mgnify:CR=1 FL=1
MLDVIKYHVSLSYLFAISIGQTAFIPYLTDMANLGKLAGKPVDQQMLVSPGLDPSEADVRFVGAMG